MLENHPSAFNKTMELLFKVLIPAGIGVGIKVCIKMQREKMTILAIFLSFFVGVGFAWLASPYIFSAVSAERASLVIAVVAMSGEKIGEYIIYKWNVDAWISVLFDNGRIFLLNMLTKKSGNK